MCGDWGSLHRACLYKLCEMTEMTEMRFEVQFEENAGGFEVRPSAGWDVLVFGRYHVL